MRRGRIVALVGIDGCGKSTQAARLAAELRHAGLRARAFENPGGRPVLDALARGAGREDGAALVGRHARTGIEIAVRSVAIVRALVWCRATGGTAVMDRYAICQLATMRARHEATVWPARLARLAPVPATTIWLRVDAGTAAARVAARGRDLETVEWLEAFDRAYADLAADAGLIEVAATGTADAVALAVQAALRG